MTQMLEAPEEHQVAVVKVDSCSYYSSTHTTYYNYKTRAMAELFAGKFSQIMENEGFATLMRGVFIKDDDNNWKTVRSYFDV